LKLSVPAPGAQAAAANKSATKVFVFVRTAD
jgi:hypothetical protein